MQLIQRRLDVFPVHDNVLDPCIDRLVDVGPVRDVRTVPAGLQRLLDRVEGFLLLLRDLTKRVVTDGHAFLATRTCWASCDIRYCARAIAASFCFPDTPRGIPRTAQPDHVSGL